MVAAEELQHAEQLAVGMDVALDGPLDPGPEHLLQVGPRHPARRDVVAVRLGAELRVERQRHLGHVHQVVERVLPILGPGAVLVELDQPLQPDLADAGRHAAGLHRHAARLGIGALDPRVAGDALLRHPRVAAVHGLLVGAGLHALAVAAALLLVDQHDAVLGPLVDRLARAGGEAGRVGAVVADARQVEEPGVVHRQLGAGGIEAIAHPGRAHRVVLVDVGGVPLLVAGQIAEHPRAFGLEAGSSGLEDGLAVVLAVGADALLSVPPLPGAPVGVGLLQQLEDLHVPELRVAAVGLGLDVGPPHVLLALAEGPGRLAGHGAALAGDAAVDVEHEGELPLGEARLVGVAHLPPKLPVLHSRHLAPPVLVSNLHPPQRPRLSRTTRRICASPSSRQAR